jgi:hypothetical protein
MRMRLDRRQLQHADLRILGADARRNRRDDRPGDGTGADTAEGFNILAWTMPFIALFVGGGLIVMVFGRWRAAPPLIPASPGPGGTPVPFDPELKRRLERELEERK